MSSSPGRRGSRTWWPFSTARGFTSVPAVTSTLGRSCGSGTVRITWTGCIVCPRKLSTEISQVVSPFLSSLLIPLGCPTVGPGVVGESRFCTGCVRRAAFLEAEHLQVRPSALPGIDGWVYKEIKKPTVVEIMKERFMLWCVLSCVVLCHVVCVLQGPDSMPRDYGAPLSQDFLAWRLPSWWSYKTALGFSSEHAAVSSSCEQTVWGNSGWFCVHMNEISLVCLYVHFPRLIYLLFLQKNNLGSARHQLLSLTTLECVYNVQEALYLSDWFFLG